MVGRPADMAALARGLGGQPESGGRGREEAEVERDGGERKPRHGRRGGRERSGRVTRPSSGCSPASLKSAE